MRYVVRHTQFNASIVIKLEITSKTEAILKCESCFTAGFIAFCVIENS